MREDGVATADEKRRTVPSPGPPPEQERRRLVFAQVPAAVLEAQRAA
jgi:hypothetical protein